MPLPYRHWFIKRLSSEFERQAAARKKASDDRTGMRDIPMGDMGQIMADLETSPNNEDAIKFKK